MTQKQYRVLISEVLEYEAIVQADDEESAREAAIQEVVDGDATFMGVKDRVVTWTEEHIPATASRKAKENL